MKLQDNTILITGGGSGIGRGLAQAFTTLGNRVVVAGRSEAKLKETVAAGDAIDCLVFDVTCLASVQEFATEATRKFPELNMLVNNAGVMRPENVRDHNIQDAEDIIATNLLGPIRLTACLLPHLLTQPSATIVNVTSGLAFVPLSATPTYSATKAALHSYSISLREQLQESSIDVVEVAPPYVQTYLTGEAHASDPRAMPLDEFIEEVMSILQEKPDAQEVLVERVRGLRHAERDGTFCEALKELTQMGKGFLL